jgi:hypothetical protein
MTPTQGVGLQEPFVVWWRQIEHVVGFVMAAVEKAASDGHLDPPDFVGRYKQDV